MDTSNQADHAGLINLLAVVVLRMRQAPGFGALGLGEAGWGRVSRVKAGRGGAGRGQLPPGRKGRQGRQGREGRAAWPWAPQVGHEGKQGC